jgi:hypothetical protein
MVTWNVLHRWLAIWEDLLKEPRDLVFTPTFPNVLRAARTEFTKDRIDKDWRNELAEMLTLLFDMGDHCIEVFRPTYGSQLVQLDQLVHQRPHPATASKQLARQSDEDIALVLTKLTDAVSPEELSAQLHDALMADVTDYGRLTALTMLLLRSAVHLHEPRHLSDILRNVLARKVPLWRSRTIARAWQPIQIWQPICGRSAGQRSSRTLQRRGWRWSPNRRRPPSSGCSRNPGGGDVRLAIASCVGLPTPGLRN